MTQVESKELALFRSVDSALAFSFNFSHGQYKASSMALVMGGPKPVGRGLGGLDGAAQAGMIKAEIEAVAPRIRGLILVARFAVKALPCACSRSCCSGFHANIEWLKAVSDISEIVRAEALSGCSTNFMLRQAMIRRYFGVKQSLSDAAVAAGVERHTASEQANKVVTYLKSEEQHARYAIEERLKSAGIVE